MRWIHTPEPAKKISMAMVRTMLIGGCCWNTMIGSDSALQWCEVHDVASIVPELAGIRGTEVEHDGYWC